MAVDGDPKAEEAPAPPRAADAAAEDELVAACSSIARHLARTGVHSVGLLPLAGRRRRGRRPNADHPEPSGLDLVPVLRRLAGALSMFVEGTVAYVGPWTDWETAALKDGRPALLLRPVGERVVEIVPPPCASAPAASASLQRALASLPPTIARVLVDLGGYVAPGRLPAVSEAVDGVVIVVAARRAWRSWVEELYFRLPSSKNLGSILIG